jgi:hypothetical protein
MCNPVSTARPELLLAKGEHEGLEWEVTANGGGYRCGYVRVPPGHPWHGKDYDDIEPAPGVHGGLTFSRPDADCGKGGADNAWWLGFDCAHWGDAPDPQLPGYREHRDFSGAGGQTVKTTAYVIAQCRRLAQQAHQVRLYGRHRARALASSWSCPEAVVSPVPEMVWMVVAVAPRTRAWLAANKIAACWICSGRVVSSTPAPWPKPSGEASVR